jgi:hypothetical protein
MIGTEYALGGVFAGQEELKQSFVSIPYVVEGTLPDALCFRFGSPDSPSSF